MTTMNRERLIGLAVWAAGEDAKQRLGLPSEWKQTFWLTRESCGTACCMAGKVAVDDGGIPIFDTQGEAFRVRLPGGKTQGVSEYAREVLGLDYFDASDLFSANNQLTDVLHVINNLLHRKD